MLLVLRLSRHPSTMAQVNCNILHLYMYNSEYFLVSVKVCWKTFPINNWSFVNYSHKTTSTTKSWQAFFVFSVYWLQSHWLAWRKYTIGLYVFLKDSVIRHWRSTETSFVILSLVLKNINDLFSYVFDHLK